MKRLKTKKKPKKKEYLKKLGLLRSYKVFHDPEDLEIGFFLREIREIQKKKNGAIVHLASKT